MASVKRADSVSSDLDISSCDREPIRTPGAIQPHGYLFELDDNLAIVRFSKNALGLVSSSSSLVGESIDRILGPELADSLRPALRSVPRADGGAPHEVWRYLGAHRLPAQDNPAIHSSDFLLVAHRTREHLVLELEGVPRGIGQPPRDLSDLFNPSFLSFVHKLDSAETLDEMSRSLCTEVQTITGFNRVLVYRFESNWNGVVIGEANDGNLPTYLHHRFPASDIPAQARELYRLNTVRIIPDANFSPVSILPAEGSTGPATIDLTYSILRSVSPVHVEYMKNMRTMSSMSISILHRGQLWGMVACHHKEPRHASYLVRSWCEQLARAFSLRLSAIVHANDFQRHIEIRNAYSKLFTAMSSPTNFVQSLVDNAGPLIEFLSANGAAIITEDQCRCVGSAPKESIVRQLATWLYEKKKPEVYATQDLVAEFPSIADELSGLAGLLAISISKLHPSYVMWFRPEVIQTIPWAGEPVKVQDFANSDRLHPRKSFETWRETVQNRSREWTDAEKEAAAELRNAIVGVVLRNAEELAALNRELTRSNRELEAFSYSVSHDLRAPLRHIVGYAEVLKSSAGEKFTERDLRYVNTIIESSEYAGQLVDKLLAFSRLGQAELQKIPVDLNVLFEETRQDVMRDWAGLKIRWHCDPLPTVDADLMMLRMAVRDLLSNAVKYSQKREEVIVEISSSTTPREYQVSIKDNGVGFDMKYSDKLFGVFQRLHRWEEYEGTGIGLANVQRVIERHGGRVWAHAEENVGAIFTFTLPR